MKSLKIVVVACSMFAAATAWSQSQLSAGNASQQITQTNNSQASAYTDATNQEKKQECVGPPSFCTLFFGS
ncbi:hypothetical protein LMG27952_05046 [Paraburkholderia hiiakae]|uniref:Uncharacterized protein n=2 Tax=Paraburkholderia hiiakae TaxID=1081782 RepID=A0ABM8NZH6_9BURK|nr:hypothetical protein LMG27952_05046 [Paraburkholderia hiiakae]